MRRALKWLLALCLSVPFVTAASPVAELAEATIRALKNVFKEAPPTHPPGFEPVHPSPAELPHRSPTLPHHFPDILDLATSTGIESVLKHPSQQEPGRAGILNSMAGLFASRPKFALVEVNAKRFGQEFMAGAYGGERRLKEAKGKLKPITESWLNTPPHKRVYVIAASQSEHDVERMRSALKADGYTVFFYKFCEAATGALCASQDVGAFFATAGHLMVIPSPSAKASDFVRVELLHSDKFKSGGIVVVMTPPDLKRLASYGAIVALIEISEPKGQPGRKKRSAT